MKGILKNTDKGWIVEFENIQRTPIGTKSWWDTIPVHPDDTKDTHDHYVPTLFNGKEVEFHVHSEYPESCNNNPFCMGGETFIECLQYYAKLI